MHNQNTNRITVTASSTAAAPDTTPGAALRTLAANANANAPRPAARKHDELGHPRHPACQHPTGYCPDPDHRLRDHHGFTSQHHRTLRRHGILSPLGIASLIALAQMQRTDTLADHLLRTAAAEGIHELASEIRRQHLHKISGIRRYLSATKTAAERRNALRRTAIAAAAADAASTGSQASWIQPMLPFEALEQG